ncbi:MAG TPA: acetyltransferase [Aridibacter sp.]|nr:acetyltransferase [Aridibacter sp.]
MTLNSKRKEPSFIYGAGALAKLLAVSMRGSNRFEPEGFIVDEEYKKSDELLGLPVLCFEEFQSKNPAIGNSVFVAIGYRRMRARKEIFDRIRNEGYRCPNYLFAGARVNEEVVLGEGNIVSDGVILDSFSRVGDNNFFRSNTYISHDCVIGDHNYFAPSCTVSGNCTVKDQCFFGVGSTLIDGLTVEDETFLSAASTLLSDTEPHSQYIGYPAKKIREHKETGIVVKR